METLLRNGIQYNPYSCRFGIIKLNFIQKLNFGFCNFRGQSNKNFFHEILDDVTALKPQFPLTQDCGNIQCLDCSIGLMYKVLFIAIWSGHCRRTSELIKES